jgi:hypothetical protein
MNRGKPMRRTGFTNRGKPLRRYTELLRSSKSRAGSGTTGEGGSVVSSAGRPRVARRHVVPAQVARLVQERSGGLCEIGPQGLEGCWGWGREKHHRISQKSGGRHGSAAARSDRPSNIILLCVFCHLVVTNCPRWAYENGAALREWQEPTAEPVLYRGDLVYLDDAGNKISHEKAGA